MVEENRNILVNQIGYLPYADKIATVITTAQQPLHWELRNIATEAIELAGWSKVYGIDKASGDPLQHVDFSNCHADGVYQLTVHPVGASEPFVIAADLYPELPNEAMAYFYFHRMGVPVEAEFLANAGHARAALHPGDDAIPFHRGWNQGTLNVRYSWADAGDFGIYPVNQAIAAWTLLNCFERYPLAFPDGSLSIPERANGIPDLLDEVRFGSTFMLGMLPPTGLAPHKVHNEQWSAVPVVDLAAENALPRYAQPPSTNATYAVARNAAHLARVFQAYDPEFAFAAWQIAQTAWQRVESEPLVYYTVDTVDDIGGGDYDDVRHEDDRYAAAVEMYLTACRFNDSGRNSYRTVVWESTDYQKVTAFTWSEVGTLGTLSLLSVANDLPAADLERMQFNLLQYADRLLQIIANEGYPTTLPGDRPYPWGSNSFLVNDLILLAYAYDLSKDLQYLKAIHRGMDYLLGNNAMKLSYITGYGHCYETDTHDRWAWGCYQKGIPYPKGWLVGGPNNLLINEPSTPRNRPAAKSYAAKNTAFDAWCSKENAINWNAPLVWVAQYINAHRADLCHPQD